MKANLAVLSILAAVFIGLCGTVLWIRMPLRETVQLSPDSRFAFPFAAHRSARYIVYLEYLRTRPADTDMFSERLDSEFAAHDVEFQVTSNGTSIPVESAGGYQLGPPFREYVASFSANQGTSYMLYGSVSQRGVEITDSPATVAIEIDPDVSKGYYVRLYLIVEACAFIAVGLAVRSLYRSRRSPTEPRFNAPHN